MGETLAERLLSGRDPGQPATTPDPSVRPADLAAAYRVQEHLVAAMRRRFRSRVVGFKIGASSERAQRFLGVSEPFSGQVLSGGLLTSPARLSAACYRFRLVEPEFAFRFDRSLPPRGRAYTREEVAAAVGTLHPAIEIVTAAYEPADWRTAPIEELVADNGAHGALVLGEGRRDWRRFDLADLRVTLSIDGLPYGEGSGRAALGHPLNALTWLVNQQSRRGRGLAPGEVVTTGVVTPFVLVNAGQRAVAQFGPFGSCAVVFDA